MIPKRLMVRCGVTISLLLASVITVKAQSTMHPYTCMTGQPGAAGAPGRDGRDGRDGLTVQGARGDAGQKGEKGDTGDTGESQCPRGSIKQCSWPGLSDSTDSGAIKDCDYQKLANDTALHVRWFSDMRVYTDLEVTCNRWYVTFDGRECDGPHPIDAIVVATNTTKNQHRPGIVEGICGGIEAGNVTVGIAVGGCPYGDLGDAHTGWISTSRMIIEEVMLVT